MKINTLKARQQLLIKLLFIITTLLLFNNAKASNNSYVVDIYGTSKISKNKIKSEFDKELKTITKVTKDPALRSSKKGLDSIANAFITIIGKLILTEDFAYVHVSPINYYENSTTVYITIDVVEKNDINRLMHFLPQQKMKTVDPNNLIVSWLKYEKAGADLVDKYNTFPKFKACPAHHCTFGFDHPSLLKYKNVFDSAENYKTGLVRVLREDNDSRKRSIAAYVLAHIKNDKELVELLLPSINDSSGNVRNSVLRVLGMTLEKNNNLQIPLNIIVDALDFPETTDRNKTLYVLLSLSNNPKNSQYIIENAGARLIAILKLDQPNNHDPAYEILKKISGKTYGERDYKSWENWLRQK